ncbi:hypothetical protein [Syntrophomonas wolfei]|jgi:hypothetical protein|uniref:hypothetical protein n=1 Tax=Syntrophomonas wolfei TaxID=863 RepID=UPI0023F49FFC|nr:hypothetical protein [Syntrophomonas wolfei]
MNLIVTHHAIKRYRERLFDYTSSKEKVKNLLIEIAYKGKNIQTRPCIQGECYEVKYKGISLVLVKNGTNSIIITCLGEVSYRKWIKHQDEYMIAGRVLYFGQV